MAQVAALLVVLFLAPHRVAVSAMATPVLHLRAPAAMAAPVAAAQVAMATPAAMAVRAAMAVEVPVSVVPAVAAAEAVASAGREVVAEAVREAVVN